MSCPASAGAAETANGAVERMVLLSLTSRIIDEGDCPPRLLKVLEWIDGLDAAVHLPVVQVFGKDLVAASRF